MDETSVLLSEEALLRDLVKWSSHKSAHYNKNSDMKFIDQMELFFEKQGYLSYKQLKVLQRIYKDNNVEDFVNSLAGC